MVIALLGNSQLTESLLSNLVEADFKLKHVSVIMKSVEDRNKIADDLGPLKGINIDSLADKLKTFKLPHNKINSYMDGINHGKVLVAINFYPNKLIISMLKDYKPELIDNLNHVR